MLRHQICSNENVFSPAGVACITVIYRYSNYFLFLNVAFYSAYDGNFVLFLLQGVVSFGAGEQLTNEYSSCIYYHSANPKWMETVKVMQITGRSYEEPAFFFFMLECQFMISTESLKD